MAEHRPDHDADMFREPAVARLLARAAEIDEARTAGHELTRVRESAVEAGISAEAFDSALAEVRAERAALAAPARPTDIRARRWAAGVVLVAVAIVAVAVGKRRPDALPARAVSPQLQEEAFLPKCVTPQQAAELVRPLLGLRSNMVVVSGTSGVLRVRATPEQMQQVRATLQKYEGAASCSVAPATKVR